MTAVMLADGLVMTAVATSRFVVVPSPILPNVLSPQQAGVPSEASAHVVRSPTEDKTRLLPERMVPVVTIAVGTSRVVLVLSPTDPTPLLPQHETAPPVATTQVFFSPEETDKIVAVAMGVDANVGETGTSLSVVPPFPSSLSPFSPQQATTPLTETAHV